MNWKPTRKDSPLKTILPGYSDTLMRTRRDSWISHLAHLVYPSLTTSMTKLWEVSSTSPLKFKLGICVPPLFTTLQTMPKVHNGSTKNSKASTESWSTQVTLMEPYPHTELSNGSMNSTGLSLNPGEHTWSTIKLAATLKSEKETSLLELFMELDTWHLNSRDLKLITWYSTG